MYRQLASLIFLLVVMAKMSPASWAQASPTYGGCMDATSRPVKSVVDSSLNDIAQATLDASRQPIIRYNPEILSQALPETRFFWYLHECGHHALGHVALGTAYGLPAERAADCWAAQALVKLQKMTPERFQQIALGFAANPGDWQHLPGPQRTLDIVGCAYASRPVLVITPAQSEDFANNIDVVVNELRTGANTIRGPFEKLSGRSKVYKATFTIYEKNPGDCSIRDHTYGKPPSTDVTYLCVWRTPSLTEAQEIYTRLFDGLKSTNCVVNNKKTWMGSEIHGKCDVDVEVEGYFGQHQDYTYEVSISLGRDAPQ